MDFSSLRTRRGLFRLFLAGFGLRFADTARAQTTAGCQIGFVNGLLQISGANCELLTPPGLGGAEVSPPSSLAPIVEAPQTTGTTSTTSTSTTSTGTTGTSQPTTLKQERMLRRRQHHQQKKQNNHDHKKSKRNRKQTHKKDKRTRQRERITSCSDFSTQKAAVEWLAQHPEDAKRLDPDGNGAACENLPAVTCKDFSTQADAEDWATLYGFTPQRDPYNLFRGANDAVCPDLPAS
jgi:hypothetical protein